MSSYAKVLICVFLLSAVTLSLPSQAKNMKTTSTFEVYGPNGHFKSDGAGGFYRTNDPLNNSGVSGVYSPNDPLKNVGPNGLYDPNNPFKKADEKGFHYEIHFGSK